MAATLEELQARIQRLEDIKQIDHLQKIYGYYSDYVEWQKIVDLFADNDASVEEADRGVYRGKEGIRDLPLRRHPRPILAPRLL